MIKVSAPGKLHLLGEHSAVYGKPAILTSVNLRLTVTISASVNPVFNRELIQLKKIIEPIIKKQLEIETLPNYQLVISSQIPIGSGLGSSAAVCAAYIGALLCFLEVKWDLSLINRLSYEAEKVFQGNPSGGDNSTVVYGGLVWFRKESVDLKLIQPLSFTIPSKLSKKFIFINTGKPKEITADMVKLVRELAKKKPKVVEKFLADQEKLVKELLPTIKEGNEQEFVRIIREGERNLETIGVVSKTVRSMIRKIEAIGGAAKISGAGGKIGGAGVVLTFHPDKAKLLKLIKSDNLPYFTADLGVEGLKIES